MSLRDLLLCDDATVVDCRRYGGVLVVGEEGENILSVTVPERAVIPLVDYGRGDDARATREVEDRIDALLWACITDKSIPRVPRDRVLEALQVQLGAMPLRKLYTYEDGPAHTLVVGLGLPTLRGPRKWDPSGQIDRDIVLGLPDPEWLGRNAGRSGCDGLLVYLRAVAAVTVEPAGVEFRMGSEDAAAVAWLETFLARRKITWEKLSTAEQFLMTREIPCSIRCWRVGGAVTVRPGEECPECGKTQPVQTLWEKLDHDLC